LLLLMQREKKWVLLWQLSTILDVHSTHLGCVLVLWRETIPCISWLQCGTRWCLQSCCRCVRWTRLVRQHGSCSCGCNTVLLLCCVSRRWLIAIGRSWLIACLLRMFHGKHDCLLLFGCHGRARKLPLPAPKPVLRPCCEGSFQSIVEV